MFNFKLISTILSLVSHFFLTLSFLVISFIIIDLIFVYFAAQNSASCYNVHLSYISLIQFHNKIGAGFDLTCFNKYPLLIPDDNDNAFIGGYKGGPDYAQMNVAFSRSVDTGTGSDLPTGHSEGDFNNGRSRRLLMPVEGGIERIGAFDCEGDLNGESHNITAIITHNNG